MPLFLCYCPDHPNSLDLRMSVRAEHLKRAKPDNESGICVKGLPLLPRPGTAQRENPPPEGTPNIAGSFMIYRFGSLEECWARLKEDVYWSANVWDKERMIVEELLEL